jgi:hypothetical protein
MADTDALAAWDAVTGNDAPQLDPVAIANPDMSVMRMGHRTPPALPLDVFGPAWADWITHAAEAAAAPSDYVAAPLLAIASVLIGHARWAQATPAWQEPPHLWVGAVGDSGSSKSPGADCLMRDVLPIIEQRMQGDFPEHQRAWRAACEAGKARHEQWQQDVRRAQKNNLPPPLPPDDVAVAEPHAPRLRQSDVTIEKVAMLLAGPAPKGLLIVRDELAGWLLGMNSYNDAGRSFWLEAYGGRSYRVERQKLPDPITIPRTAVAVTGGTQPDKLAEMFKDADDGLLARFLWVWPDSIPFRVGRFAPDAAWATEALDRLRLLDLAPGQSVNSVMPPPLPPGMDADGPPCPIMVPLAPDAVPMIEEFGQDMQRQQEAAGGLMRSTFGKARGLALRLSLVLAFLRWTAESDTTLPPVEITGRILLAACYLVSDYFIPMAERVFGDAATPQAERGAATLARWIIRERAQEVHVRTLQRVVRLPGLTTAAAIHAAVEKLLEAGWLLPPERGAFQARARLAYPVNPAVFAGAAS